MGLFDRRKYCLWLAAFSAAAPAFGTESSETFAGSPPQVLVTASRLGEGLAGSATTVITAQDIAADPADDLPQILARQAGVQLQSIFGGVNGAQAAVSLRGFGATATENTLVLVNGRRVNDPDQSNIDFSAIPAASIERIEITRGNSAAVLYGDGAVGGVINIITKNGDNSEPGSAVEAGFGSFQYRSLDFATNQKIGTTSFSAYGTEIVSNGYRDNNALRERNFDAELRQETDVAELYLNLRGDDQHLGLPGALPIGVWKTTPKSTLSPLDFGNLESINATLGATSQLADGVELVADAGIRHKEEQSIYHAFGGSFFGIDVTTASLTPRINIEGHIFDMPSKLITGFDLYQSYYRSYYSVAAGAVPYQNNLLDQRSSAIYGEENLTLTPSTSLGLGLRLQRADLTARQKIDVFAPGNPGSPPGTPLRQTDDEYAAHLGVEQRLNTELTLFARLGHAMRLPNMDDRNFVTVFPTDFMLRTQTSNDVEIGLQTRWGRWQGQTRLFAMDLHNEIDFDPGANGGFGANVNLDPTRRLGSETEFSVDVTPDIHVSGNISVTKAEFRDGPYKGREVPQVALLTGNLGAFWNIWKQYLTLDGDLRTAGPRRLGDDFTGRQPAVPSSTLVDLKLSGRLEQITWSLAVQNLFDLRTYQLGYSGFSGNSVYPLAGRDIVGRLGVSF